VALTINARSLRNLLRLRLSKRALAEFQALARLLFLTLPEEHRVIYSDIPEVIELVILENVGSETIN
jgi:thymidylate synthase ThyX